MRVLFISRYVPFPGGRENFVFELSRELSKQGVEVHVVTPDGLIGDGFRVHAYSQDRSVLAEVIKRIQPDVVNSHTFYLCDPAIDICKEMKIPFVLTLHGDQFKIGDKQRQDLVRTVSARSDLVINVCEEGKKSLISNTNIAEQKIKVVYNGVNNDLFKKDIFSDYKTRDFFRKKNGLPEGSFIWITPARMIWYKGLSILLEMIADNQGYLRENKQYFLICTPNTSTSPDELSFMNELLVCVNKNKISDLVKIIFSGYEYMPYLYQSADAFMLPSLSEQLPISILEAMANELAVVSTKVGGIPEIINNGVNGLLADPNNKISLLECVQKIIKNRDFRKSLELAGKNTVSEKFSIKIAAKAYVATFLILLK